MAFNTQVKLGLSLISITATAITLTACAGQNQASNSKEIKIDGSSTVYPISATVAKEFNRTPEGKNVKVDVQFSGTTSGFRKFCAGEIDISDASRPILIKEMDACVKAGVAFIELPVAFDALTIAVNPQNNWAKDITVAELKKIWQKAAEGKIVKWNQIRPSYPDRPLKLFGAGKDSGTYDYFNEAIMGSKYDSRSDYIGSENDNVLVNGISQDPNALGYIPFAYFEANQRKLRALPVNDGKGAVFPSAQVVKTAQYQPLSRPLFIYVNARSAQKKPELRAFVQFYLRNAKNLTATLSYVTLPDEGYRLAEIQFFRAEVGTAFKGVPEPYVTVTELLRRQVQFQSEQEASGKK